MVSHVYNLTCLCHLWTEGPTHKNGIKKLLTSRYSVTGDIDADPSAPNQKNYSEYAKPVLVLICHWLGTLITEGILTFEMWCLRLSSSQRCLSRKNALVDPLYVLYKSAILEWGKNRESLSIWVNCEDDSFVDAHYYKPVVNTNIFPIFYHLFYTQGLIKFSMKQIQVL